MNFWVLVHSPSKCLAWVKKCHHIWLYQNFDPSLLTNKLWHVVMGMKQKNSKWPTKKNKDFQNRQFSKIFSENYRIGPWNSIIDWCEGNWCGSTYIVVRLSEVSLKTGKKYIFCVFRLFLSLCRTASWPYRLCHINGGFEKLSFF